MAVNTNRLKHKTETVGLLVSGGLDSSILLKHMLDMGRRVKPFYIRCGLYWQAAEESVLDRYLNAVADDRLAFFTVLNLPLGDLYGDHWSVTGRGIPAAGTPDEAVFLPGRNALLTIKAAVWCQLHGISELGIATLRSNPFHDASASFFDQLGDMLSKTETTPIRFARPFGELGKRQVMEIGRSFPLHLTFSCLTPRHRMHCGLCNKCAERQEAFRLIDMKDPTRYANRETNRIMVAI
jgi:7-cyano-7-deazaguanine synthase